MRERWRVRRGWIKVHTMIDLEAGQIFGPEVTDESILDDSLFTPLLDQAESLCGSEQYIHRVLGDVPMTGITSSTLSSIGRSSPESRAGMTPRRDPECQLYRAECVRMKRNSGGYRICAEEEGVYSAVKKIFTEDVQSSAREGMSVLQYVGRNGLIGP